MSKWNRFLHLALMKIQFVAPIYWCLVSISWGIRYNQEAGERRRRTLDLETSLTRANLQALKMQLQPHFLFNALNAISSLVHESPKKADDMIVSLSQFLRTTLDVSGENEIPLRREIAFVNTYLEIQQIRFSDRLRIHWDINASTLDGLVPPLILQPLVENAIRYGIEPREAGGVVTIRALRSGPSLRLEVSDDGAGFRGGQLLEAAFGIGLSNTKVRLQTLYGDQHQFKLTAMRPTGACITIEIPFRLAPANVEPKA